MKVSFQMQGAEILTDIILMLRKIHIAIGNVSNSLC